VKKLIFIILLAASVINLKAQSELTLPFLRDVFQTTYVNPSLIPEHTVSIGLPISFSVQLIQNGFVFNNFITQKGNKFTISPNDLYENLKDNNMIHIEENADLFHLRFKAANNFFWFGIRQHSHVTTYVPKDLFAIPVKGNAPYIGSQLDFSALSADVSFYNEYTFGMSKELPRWVIGGRISLLQGLSNIYFNPDNFTLEVDSTEFIANADGKIYTSGIPKNSEGNISFDHTGEMSWITRYLSNFSNMGFALSGGVTYKLNDRARFSFSFSNLGFINWKDSVETYSMTGSSTYDGLSVISDYLYNRDTNVDSVLNKMKDDFVQDTIRDAYKTWLHPNFNLSASYDIARRTTIGLSISAVINKKFYPAITLGIQQGIGRVLNMIATISYNQRTIKNLGVGLVLKPGPFQFFIIADNVYAAISPMYTTSVNIRTGINLVFGRVKTADRMSYK
jgi:hypothetical protein